MEVFATDRQRANEENDAWASLCALASTDNEGNAKVRTLVLRNIGGHLAVFVNKTSPKWSQLANHPEAQLLIFLSSISVQYRLDVSLKTVPKKLVNESWLLRPDIPKQMDWFYSKVQPQSSIVESRSKLEHAFRKHQSAEDVEQSPESAQGLFLIPHRIERLELSSNKIHSRLAWRLILKGNKNKPVKHWQKEQLVP